jgi:hypothetical protein
MQEKFMSTSYKPNDYTTVSPYLIVNGASGTIDFLKEDEDKRGGVKDAGGTTWWIATKVE